MAQDTRTIWQPIHPAIRDKLDPEYVAFHDEHMQYVQSDNSKPWDGSARTKPSLPPGGLKPVPVGKTVDFDVAPFRVRAYTPTGECSSERGWPVMIWFHGGGWAIGGLDENKDFCTMVAQGSRCVVVTVGYRLAPENPFPAAVSDAVDAVRWVYSSPPELGPIDISKIALGGTSAGANLAITAALTATGEDVQLPSAKPSRPWFAHPAPVCLVLAVPVVDNTATAETIWKRNAETAPWLTPGRMEWYRKMYFTRIEDRASWDASPNLAPESLLKKLPSMWVAVSDQDLLAPEGESFGQQLTDLGVNVEMVQVKGGTHSIFTMGGKIARAKAMMEDAVKYLEKAFYA